MNKLVYDLDYFVSRYKKTITMDFIKTSATELNKTKNYQVQSITCTSEVRSTNYNWFYILPYGIDREEFILWLKEFTPLFNYLQIELLPEETFQNIKSNLSGTLSGNLIDITNFNPVDGKLILLSHEDKTISHITDLFNQFSKWCYTLDNLKEVILNSSKSVDNFLNLNPNFISQYFTTSLENVVVHNKNNKNIEYFTISNILHYTPEIEQKIIIYLKELVQANLLYFKSKLARLNEEDRIIVKVLYSKHTNQIENYLVHHLLRVGISSELNIFRSQYYRVKQLLPDLSFWQLILIAQMGMNMHYYWWFTKERFFRLPTEKEFDDAIKKANTTSSNIFFDQFKKIYSPTLENKIKKYYEEEKLDKLLLLIQDTLRVKLKPEKIDKFINLRLQSSYIVSQKEDDYYFIVGDDLIIRRYKQSNFN